MAVVVQSLLPLLLLLVLLVLLHGGCLCRAVVVKSTCSQVSTC
jgi:hypothetical protein